MSRPSFSAPSFLPLSQNDRNALKEAFIDKKKTARANIALLKQGLDILKDKELKQLHEEFREVDGEFRALGVLVEHDALMEGAKARKGGDGFDPTRAKNDELLDKAGQVQQDSLQKLKQGLMTVEQTKEQGKVTAAQLEQDREKLKRIDAGLDEVQVRGEMVSAPPLSSSGGRRRSLPLSLSPSPPSHCPPSPPSLPPQSELELSQVLLTRFVKRIATDKVVIAFATLLILGIVGIVVYATMYPEQTTFNVPDVVKPDTAAASALVNGATTTPGSNRVLRGGLAGVVGEVEGWGG